MSKSRYNNRFTTNPRIVEISCQSNMRKGARLGRLSELPAYCLPTVIDASHDKMEASAHIYKRANVLRGSPAVTLSHCDGRFAARLDLAVSRPAALGGAVSKAAVKLALRRLLTLAPHH